MEYIKRKIKEIKKCKTKIEVELHKGEMPRHKSSFLTLEYINSVELLNALDKNEKHMIFEILPLTPIDFQYNEQKDILFEHKTINEEISKQVINQFKNFDFDNQYFYDNLDEINFSISDSEIDFVREFLKTLDTETTMLFDRIKEDIIFYPSNLPTNGRCFSFPDLNKYYIYVNTKYSLSHTIDSYILAHEFGHIYEIVKIDSEDDYTNKFNKFYTEVCSCFFDTIYTNYLIEEHNAKDAILLKRNNLSEMLSNFKTMLYILENKNISFEDSTFEILDFNQLNDKENLKRKGDILGIVRYGYGRLLANYFANTYKKSPKEGLIKIKEFLSNRSKLTNEELFETLKIKDFNFLQEEIEKSDKQIKRIK